MIMTEINSNIMKRNALFFIVLLFLASCNNYPNVNDEVVKNLALESAKHALLNLSFSQKNLVKLAIRGDTVELKNNLDAIRLGYFSSFDCQFLNHFEDDKFIQTLDSAIQAKKITIENVRVDNVSSELKKSECSAELQIGELRYQISYSAQYSEDDKLIVQTQLKR